MDNLCQTLDELLTQKVRTVSRSVFKDIVRRLEQLEQEFSELKEGIRMIQTQHNPAAKGHPAPEERRVSARDIRQFRKHHGISQEVLAHLLHVHKLTVSRWERKLCVPQESQQKELASLLSLKEKELEQRIKTAKSELYN